MKHVLRLLRDGLHRRAYSLHIHGHTEAALTLWAIVDELDNVLPTTNGDGDG